MFPCYTERNVNQCILNGSVFQTRERERERESERERGRERERGIRMVFADITVHPLVIYILMLTPR